MANKNLSAAKNAKNDEFYTQYADIQKEVNAYLEYDENVFRGKTVLLPCDDPEWSNFTKFFAQNFERFGLKKLISTSYAIESKKIKQIYQPTLFETEAPQFDKKKTRVRGKIFVLDHDTNKNGRIDIEDLEWNYLKGDGDFRSDEVKKLRDEADIIVTNPPFSLFREFLSWLIEADKQFLIIGNMNAITYKEVFPLIKENKLWLGESIHITDAIPSDCKGVMGVPKSFLDKYCPEQFEIVGCAEGESGREQTLRAYSDSFSQGGEEMTATLKTDLTVADICEGAESEIKEWFKTINIAGVPLNDQELLNAVYSGPFVTAAKKKGVSNCPLCALSHSANATKIWSQSEMDADHVTAWSKGGATNVANCQMLCKTHNRSKGNR